MVRAFISLTSVTNVVMKLCGLDSPVKVVPQREHPKRREVNVIPCFLTISFWTLVKTLPADGASTGCQAGWAKAGPPSGSIPRTALQRQFGKARKDWSPTTSPVPSPGCLLGTRGEAWGVQPLWLGLTFRGSPRICDIPGNRSDANHPPLFFLQPQEWDFTTLTAWWMGAWAWIMGTLQTLARPGALASPFPTVGEASARIRGAELGGSFPQEAREPGWVWSQGLQLFERGGKLHLQAEPACVGVAGREGWTLPEVISSLRGTLRGF